MKRLQYELNAIKTFYLSNINAQDILGALSQMISTQMKAPKIIVDKNLNSVTIRDTPAIIELADKLIQSWDKPKGEDKNFVFDCDGRTYVIICPLHFLPWVHVQHCQGVTYSSVQVKSTPAGWRCCINM